MGESRAGFRQEGVTTLFAFCARCSLEAGSIAPRKHEAATKIGGLCLRSLWSQLFYVCRSCLVRGWLKGGSAAAYGMSPRSRI